jgi:hypothetical protein
MIIDKPEPALQLFDLLSGGGDPLPQHPVLSFK